MEGRRFPYNFQELLKPRRWRNEFRYRNQRINRGWSDQDAWGGGEHIASVSAGILRELGDEKNIVDWDWYFRNNNWETFGYNDLNEVAQDLENWLDWEEMSYSDPVYQLVADDFDTRMAIEIQLYDDYKNAMKFVAENIGALWW